MDHGIDKLVVRTDSEFLCKAANDWMPRWSENGWRKSDGNAVKNAGDFQNLNKLMSDPRIDVRFVSIVRFLFDVYSFKYPPGESSSSQWRCWEFYGRQVRQGRS